MSSSPILQISNLTKIYCKSHLGKKTQTIGVQDLSLEIQSGEIFGLLGLNGAGKTTTLKLILGLLFPSQGEIFVENHKVPSIPAIQQIGFLPEVPYFPKYLNVEEVVRFYGELSGVSKQELSLRIKNVLEGVRMTAYKNKKIRECSKGMMQRVSLAQALIHDPKFLILDEPITGLDPLGLTEMREMILNLNQKGKTILFSSHMISEVEKMAHRVAILVKGRCVKVLKSSDWLDVPGKLEKIFIETVKNSGGM